MKKLTFEELFEIEIEGWRHGLEANSETLRKCDILKMLEGIREVYELAIENLHSFSLVEVAERFSQASRGVITAREIAFFVLRLFPPRSKLYPTEEPIFDGLHRQVELVYGAEEG